METRLASAVEINSVSSWFGESFFKLHPQLQKLHLQGGTLKGKIKLRFGKGLAGYIGKRMARKIGVPLQPGEHELQVKIRHDDSKLYWSRCFDGEYFVQSIFTPVGDCRRGYWLEKTGPITLKLSVDVIEAGWHWRVIAVRLFGLPLPLFLFPDSVAYKKVIDDRYQFHVGFSMPWLGQLFCYEGSMTLELC
jgi:Domain of unknown function (DUF4166)